MSFFFYFYYRSYCWEATFAVVWSFQLIKMFAFSFNFNLLTVFKQFNANADIFAKVLRFHKSLISLFLYMVIYLVLNFPH